MIHHSSREHIPHSYLYHVYLFLSRVANIPVIVEYWAVPGFLEGGLFLLEKADPSNFKTDKQARIRFPCW